MESVHLKLNEKLMQLKKKNPKISQRAFALKLGISSGALNEILQGRRKISFKLAEKLADRLLLSPAERTEFLSSFRAEDDANLGLDYLRIRDDQFQAISEWPHFAILNLVKSKTCKHEPTWFAKQLNIPVKNIQGYLDRLQRLGFLSYEKSKYVRAKSRFQTSDDILNLSIQKSHIEDLEFIKESVDSTSVDERDLTSMTFLLDPARMPEFKKWIRSAQDKFSLKFETTESETAYRMLVSLFPLKKNSKGENT